MKLLFLPLSIISGLVAGMLAKKVFERLWGLIDDEDPPDPKHAEISLPKMLAAQALEGATFRMTRGLADHQIRRAFAKTTGAWPGEERPEPE
jgi:hypothetical protein